MKSVIALVLGNLDEKNAYHQINKRAKKLPKNYCTAFKKIRAYLYTYGGDAVHLEMLSELLGLLESGVAQKKTVAGVIGTDAAAFCDELIAATNITRKTKRDKLNQEIEDYFKNKEGYNV